MVPGVGNGAGAGGDNGDADRISALPDAVLHHALGFLPAPDAVRMCVLGRRWRHQWRALPRLRITAGVGEAPGSAGAGAEKLHVFVNQLLQRRQPGLVLDECEIDLRGFGYANREHVNRWIRHALLLRARVMSLRWISGVQSQTLASMFLKELHLSGVNFEGNTIDFSSCPALENLEITSSEIDAHGISSPSAKRLRLVKCGFILCSCPDYRTRISTPSLVSLEVEDCSGLPPVLQNMPSLQTASVCLGCFDEDHWEKSCSAGFCGFCCDDEVGEHVDECVLLGGLSNATNLKIRASFGIMFTLKMDLERDLRTFSNLRTLYLLDWCLAGDHLTALICFLKHTPSLEKLTLQLCQREICVLEEKDSNRMDQQILLRLLKRVDIKCAKIDERVNRNLKAIYSALGVCHRTIIITISSDSSRR